MQGLMILTSHNLEINSGSLEDSLSQFVILIYNDQKGMSSLCRVHFH